VKWWAVDGKPLLDLGRKDIYSSYKTRVKMDVLAPPLDSPLMGVLSLQWSARLIIE
jgi:hypothetical protein